VHQAAYSTFSYWLFKQQSVNVQLQQQLKNGDAYGLHAKL
jgi:hypothetical protein